MNIFIIILAFLFFSCKNTYDINALDINGNVNVLIEIKSGTLEKWEFDKNQNTIIRDYKNGKPRIIQYLGYPGNYGMIPNTISLLSEGGDGDPLDIFVIGEPLERGDIAKVKLIGVIKMLDNNEVDDKLIGVQNQGSIFSRVESLEQLQNEYPGVIEIFRLWLGNYKGIDGNMIFKGIYGKNEADSILNNSIIN